MNIIQVMTYFWRISKILRFLQILPNFALFWQNLRDSKGFSGGRRGRTDGRTHTLFKFEALLHKKPLRGKNLRHCWVRKKVLFPMGMSVSDLFLREISRFRHYTYMIIIVLSQFAFGFRITKKSTLSDVANSIKHNYHNSSDPAHHWRGIRGPTWYPMVHHLP